MGACTSSGLAPQHPVRRTVCLVRDEQVGCCIALAFGSTLLLLVFIQRQVHSLNAGVAATMRMPAHPGPPQPGESSAATGTTLVQSARRAAEMQARLPAHGAQVVHAVARSPLPRLGSAVRSAAGSLLGFGAAGPRPAQAQAVAGQHAPEDQQHAREALRDDSGLSSGLEAGTPYAEQPAARSQAGRNAQQRPHTPHPLLHLAAAQGAVAPELRAAGVQRRTHSRGASTIQRAHSRHVALPTSHVQNLCDAPAYAQAPTGRFVRSRQSACAATGPASQSAAAPALPEQDAQSNASQLTYVEPRRGVAAMLSPALMHAQLNAVEAQLLGAQSLLQNMAAQLGAARGGVPHTGVPHAEAAVPRRGIQFHQLQAARDQIMIRGSPSLAQRDLQEDLRPPVRAASETEHIRTGTTPDARVHNFQQGVQHTPAVRRSFGAVTSANFVANTITSQEDRRLGGQSNSERGSHAQVSNVHCDGTLLGSTSATPGSAAGSSWAGPSIAEILTLFASENGPWPDVSPPASTSQASADGLGQSALARQMFDAAVQAGASSQQQGTSTSNSSATSMTQSIDVTLASMPSPASSSSQCSSVQHRLLEQRWSSEPAQAPARSDSDVPSPHRQHAAASTSVVPDTTQQSARAGSTGPFSTLHEASSTWLADAPASERVPATSNTGELPGRNVGEAQAQPAGTPFYEFLLRSANLLLPAHMRTPPAQVAALQHLNPEGAAAPPQRWAPRAMALHQQAQQQAACWGSKAGRRTFQGHLVGAPSEVLAGRMHGPRPTESAMLDALRRLPGVNVESGAVHSVVDALQGRATCCRMAHIWYPGTHHGTGYCAKHVGEDTGQKEDHKDMAAIVMEPGL